MLYNSIVGCPIEAYAHFVTKLDAGGNVDIAFRLKRVLLAQVGVCEDYHGNSANEETDYTGWQYIVFYYFVSFLRECSLKIIVEFHICTNLAFHSVTKFVKVANGKFLTLNDLFAKAKG